MHFVIKLLDLVCSAGSQPQNKKISGLSLEKVGI